MLMRDKLHSESSNHVEMNLESPRHVNVRDWLNLARGNIVIDPSGNSNISRGELFLADSPKVAGIKRHRSDSNQSPTSDKSTIEDIVHARKKYEIVHEKSNEHALCDKKQSDVIKEECIPRCTLPLESFFPSISGERLTLPSVSSLKTTCKDKVSVPSISTCQTACIDQTVTLKSSFYSNYPTKPNHRFPMESNETIMTTDSPDLVNRHEISNLYWKDRFLQVQTFLKACDESSQEDYIQMLRSLSSSDRSKHAAALEKRAIHLLLEEGKELHLMKVLNVFGNASPVDQITFSFDKSSDAGH